MSNLRKRAKKETPSGESPAKEHVEIEFEKEPPPSEEETPKRKFEKIFLKKEPKNWKTVWDKIVEMRSKKTAPVDTMGCGSISDRNEPKEFRYQTLVSLMLSAQTRDEITAAAMSNLKKHGLNIPNILTTDEEKIDSLISKVGFHKRKAEYIKRTTVILHEKYGDDIPPTVEELMELPGVGPKMAMLTMQEAWGKSVGIGVDTHVHRISNRLHWVKNTSNPEATRKNLEGWLPKEHWAPINKLLVGFGQTVCTPVNPKCGECAVNDLCPSAFKESKKRKST